MQWCDSMMFSSTGQKEFLSCRCFLGVYGVGQVDRAESIPCGIIHLRGSRSYSTLFGDWASVGLSLPENRRRSKKLQNLSRRSSLFLERALEHGASLEGIPVARGSETTVSGSL